MGEADTPCATARRAVVIVRKRFMASVLVWMEKSPTQIREEICPDDKSVEHRHVAGVIAGEKAGSIY